MTMRSDERGPELGAIVQGMAYRGVWPELEVVRGLKRQRGQRNRELAVGRRRDYKIAGKA